MKLPLIWRDFFLTFFIFAAEPNYMKRILLTLTLLLTVAIQAQKIKGSKNVTSASRDIAAFDAIEVTGDIDVFLIKSDHSEAEIEADDNLHDNIRLDVNAGTLYIASLQPISRYKKYSVKISYGNLSKITARNEAKITSLNTLQVPDIEIKLQDQSRFFATARTDRFVLHTDGKSKTELNLNSSDAIIEMNGNSQIKALISATNLNTDLYMKSDANIEGDCAQLRMRLDNNAKCIGKNLSAKNADIQTEGYSKTSVEVLEKAVISASGSSEIELFGEQKIEINAFRDNAVISKKNNKVK